jgi:hypothetical protein
MWAKEYSAIEMLLQGLLYCFLGITLDRKREIIIMDLFSSISFKIPTLERPLPTTIKSTKKAKKKYDLAFLINNFAVKAQTIKNSYFFNKK